MRLNIIKILKILLLIIALFSALTFLFATFNLVREQILPPLYDATMIGLCVLLTTICAIYHITSFSHYRKKVANKKIGKLLWIGAICCSLFAFYVAGAEYVKIAVIEARISSVDYEKLFAILLVFLFGVCNLIEIVDLKKRIKQQEKNTIKEEIEEIGNALS